MSEGVLDKGKFEMIEAYVLDRLPTADRERFEEELAKDAGLRYEVELQRENMLAVELGGLTRTLDGIIRQAPAEGAGSDQGGAWRSYLKYAAAVALLISVALWWMGRPSANERLYAEYHVADPGLPVPMSVSGDPVFHDAMVAYRMGEYAEAASKWAPLLQADPTNDTLRFYSAGAWLELDQAAKAIPLFEELAASSTSTFQHKAQWFLFLAYVRSGATDKLATIGLDDDPVYGERVRKIKAELERR